MQHASRARAVLFHTPQFFAFFLIVLALYPWLGHRQQNAMLLAASYLFYASWDWRFAGLLAASTAVDYTVALFIASALDRDRRGRARIALAVSIGANLAILGFFKYFNFFIESAEQVFRAAGYDGSLWTLSIILPVGISFYTFQSMSYTIDVYRRELPATRAIVDFALYVSFFPQLVAGPIERATRLLPQVQRPRMVTRTDWEEGLMLFALGFFRKVAIADPAGALADRYFADPGAYATAPLMAGLVLYSFQIYNDFAGYSDMARGSARMLGFTLMRNFRHPYFASSLSDFWRRWHISLSTWLRDYLYIPLGGSRGGPVRTRANLMATMLLGGLWHGANWTFLAWGALHGLYLSVQRTFSRVLPREAREGRRLWTLTAPVRRVAASALVCAVVGFTWLFFRSPDFGTAATYAAGILAFAAGGEGAIVPAAVIVGLTMAIDVPQALSDDECVFLGWPVAGRAATATAALLFLLISGSTDAPFIYFQF